MRHRFLQYHAGVISFVSRDGSDSTTIETNDFETIWRELRQRSRRRDWLLESKISAQHHDDFDGSFRSLLRWAFDEKLLPGRKGSHIAFVFSQRRNMSGHPTDRREPPTGPARNLCEVAELINCLWGERTTGGHLFPAPHRIHRVLFAITCSADGRSVSFGHAQTLTNREDNNADEQVMLVLASTGEELFGFHAGFEATRGPTALVWGPGERAGALEFLANNQVEEDDVDFADRLFLIRCGCAFVARVWPFDWPIPGVELPRSPEAVGVLSDDDQLGNWDLVQADFPDDALQHVVERRNPETRMQHRMRRWPRCSCGVDDWTHGVSWSEALDVVKRVRQDSSDR